MISKLGENLVFLLGVPRSGTTLLSVMLDAHPLLRCPPEPWLMLALESTGRTSAHSAADAPVLYRAFKDFSDPQTSTAAARSYATVAYNRFLNGTAKQVLIDKTPRNYLILPYLQEIFPRARYVILWRNPLDIAASMRVTWQVDLAAQLQARQDHLNCIDLVVGLRRLLDFSKSAGDRAFALNYERLVSQPRKTLTSLSTWLKVKPDWSHEFDLVGGEFDRGDIGDKKILASKKPHCESVGRWKQVFQVNEVHTLVESIGPHLMQALGYGDVLTSVLDGRPAPSPGISNAYAQQLESSLRRRRDEYESVSTFCDLASSERSLHQALHDRTVTPGQPVIQDLATEIKLAFAAAQRLKLSIAEGRSRIDDLQTDLIGAAARLEEARSQSRQITDAAKISELELTHRLASQSRQLESAVQGAAEARERLRTAELQLDRTASNHSAQCQAIDSLARQLDETRATLHRTNGDLIGHQAYVVELSQKLEQSNAATQQNAVAFQQNSAALQQASEELTRANLSAAELSRRVNNLSEDLSVERDRTVALETDLKDSERTIALMRRPAENRRQWPWARPETSALPATLPGGKAWPKISVVTPSFNHGSYIEQTILSVLNQNYPNLEYILMDGQSTDETLSIVDRYRDRIANVVSEKDRGQSHAINRGFERATGELFTWINSDDMLEPGALVAQAMAFHTSGADMVAGVCTLHTGGVIASRHLTACASGPLPTEELLDLEHRWLNGQFFYQPEVMFTRDLWLRAGGQLDESLYYSMDYDLWLRFAACGAKLHVIGRPVALYRVHDEQKTFLKDDYLPELRRVRKSFLQRQKRDGKNGHVNGRETTHATADFSGHTNGSPLEAKTHLRALFFNDLGDVGGAAIAHQRLAASMALAGHEAIPLAICPTLTACTLSNEIILQAIADRKPDVVFLGNIHSAQLDPAIIGLISNRWPTLQVLHDLYSLTGRCAYNGNCTRHRTGCDDSCPTAEEYPALERSLIENAWQIKNEVMLNAAAPVLAAVSQWTEEFARNRFAAQNDHAITSTASGHLSVESESRANSSQASGQRGLNGSGRAAAVAMPAAKTNRLQVISSDGPDIARIRYGLPTDVFKPRDKSTCRDILALPQDRFIVLFSSSQLSDRRKGLHLLKGALRQLNLPDLLAVCIGQADGELLGAGVECRSVGYVTDAKKLAMLYSAADIFAGPSLVETFGQVFIEAAACGTPSVGFATAGGVTDAINDGVSGLLAPAATADDLAVAIRTLYEDPQLRRDLGAWGRMWVENEYSLHSAYQRIFSQLKQIGLIDRLHLPPKVSFIDEDSCTEPVFYLDPPPPIPTSEQLLAETREELYALAAKLRAVQSDADERLERLRSQSEALAADSNARMTHLQSERDNYETQSGQLARERARLASQIEDLEKQRESLRMSIEQITHTRLWRMVGAVYPIYQKAIRHKAIPKPAKWPVDRLGKWMADRSDAERDRSAD